MGPSIADPTDSAAFDLDLDLIVEVAAPLGLDLADLERLARFVLTTEESRGRWTLAVVLTDDERLRALHRDFMGQDTPTDVMTFPLADGAAPAEADRGGDVVVSVERAADQAGDFDQTTGEEVRFLVVHGLLHLCGWDDATDGDRAQMLERQTALIAAYEASRR